MTDKSEDNRPIKIGASPLHLARDGHVMRSMVRNMVVNMETVLNDLQGIMGDIQSLVVQIDTVTDKIDKQCGAEENSVHTSKHCVKKPQCVHGAQSYPSAVHNVLYAQNDSDSPQSQSCLTPSRDSSNVQPVVAFRRDNRPAFGFSNQPAHSRPLSNDLCQRIDKSRQHELRMPSSSKSFSYFPKDGCGVMSPSGSVAIVHPTIFCKPPEKPSFSAMDQHLTKLDEGETGFGNVKLALQDATCMDPSKFMEFGMKSNQHFFAMSPLSHSDSTHTKYVLSRQNNGITSVYNKHFQPVTPTEQRSPIAQHTSHTVKQIPFKHGRPKQINVEGKTLSPRPYHKYTTIGDSLPGSPRMRKSATELDQDSNPNSPRLNRASVKPFYHQIEGSSSSSKSQISVRKPGVHHYYYSIESDLDSIHENPEARSMTPDIDWSYLNLIGDRHAHGNITSRLSTIGSDNTYEIPVAPAPRIHQPFQMLQNSPDIVSKLHVFQLDASPSTELHRGLGSIPLFNDFGFMNKMYNNPVVAHVFCSEVNSFESGEYCGCYEAAMDSILENIAGFESFDEACAHLDSEEMVIESYVSFDNDFEEDDWDLGMRHEDADDLDMPSFIIHETDDSDQSLFGSFEIFDDNQNIFENTGSKSFNGDNQVDPDNKSKRPMALLSDEEEMTKAKGNKRRLSPSFTDDEVYDNVAGCNSYTDDDCCALKPSVSNQHQNFILWPKILTSADLILRATKPKSIVELEAQMSSSDASSCQAVGSGSPMSFSSPEAAFTSPDTDRFVTSSEGDDLLTSQEEAYFLSSETYDNTEASARKTNISQLRREFFESLYTVCDRYEKEKVRDNFEARRVTQQDNVNVDRSLSRVDNDNVSEAGSYHEDITSYNKNVNTWTAYAIVHMHADDVSDSTSDMINDNNVSHSMTSSYLDADNIGTAPGSQALTY